MQWLQRFLDRLLSVFPRLKVIPPDERGVRCTPGLRKGMGISELAPGWWLYWPLFQILETIRVKTQVKDLRAQSIWSRDRKELTISGAIRYRVKSAKKALYEVLDYDQNIQTVALGIIQEYARQHDLTELDTGQLEKEMLKEIKKASDGWGLYIEKVSITDIGRTNNIRVL